AEGDYRDAPLLVSGKFDWSGRILKLAVERSQWKSVTASGDVDIPPDAPFSVATMLHVGQLADLAPMLGTPVSGGLDAKLQLQRQRGQAVLDIDATGHDVRVQDASLQTLTIGGDVVDPFAQPRLMLKLTGSGISANRFSGS